MLIAPMVIVGCATGRAGREGCDGQACTTSSPLGTAERNSQPFGERRAQLEAFQPKEALAGEQCSALSISNGSVQIDATGSQFPAVLQQSTPVRPNDLHLVVNFGSDFPSFSCTDLASEARMAIVDETWPASATGGTFTVTASDRCSVATLELRDVVTTSPGGQEVDLGDILIENDAWQWWPAFECRLGRALTE